MLSVDMAMKALKEKKIRLTPQRLELINILSQENKHWTVEELYHILNERMPSVSITTIYNNINLFCELEMVKEIQFGESLSKYEWKKRDHYHIVCKACGDIVDVWYPTLKEVETVAESISKFQISSHNLQFYGVCSQCSE
ncbi:Fur family transcriptional regulator [Niallia sp. NCCP-28]|uniref:Fur family transcriptional regulator n=1 Tax=Niallia sp. NCCP-28 TaxID=2934712 RepID=UPI002087C811|nr:Fur family transcriptional regulator [Niallia sp. NCCP-28]GKU81791.1 transcriptional repressor [Niallia sp. NCCP-28]